MSAGEHLGNTKRERKRYRFSDVSFKGVAKERVRGLAFILPNFGIKHICTLKIKNKIKQETTVFFI